MSSFKGTVLPRLEVLLTSSSFICFCVPVSQVFRLRTRKFSELNHQEKKCIKGNEGNNRLDPRVYAAFSSLCHGAVNLRERNRPWCDVALRRLGSERTEEFIKEDLKQPRSGLKYIGKVKKTSTLLLLGFPV